MNRSEAALVLAKAQAFDRRTVGEVDVEAWAEALADVDYADAAAAVTEHYRTETAWLMPAHLTGIISDNLFRLRVRLKAHGQPDFPSGLDQLDEKGYRIQYQAWLLRGKGREEAHALADRDMGITRGELVSAPPEFQAQLEAMSAARGVSHERKTKIVGF